MTSRTPQPEIGTINATMSGDATPPERPLRLGLICNSCLQPLWIRKALGDLVSFGIVEIPVVAAPDPSHKSAFSRIGTTPGDMWGGRSHWFYRLYQWLDSAVSTRNPDAMSTGPMEEIAPMSSRVVIGSEGVASEIRLTLTQLEAIASHDLDVVLCSGLVVEGINELSLAREGVWTAECYGNSLHRDGAQAFWEVMERVTILKVEICRQDVSLEKRQVLCRSILPVHLPEDRWSVGGASNRLLWVASTLLGRKLKDLHLHGPRSLNECSDTGSSAPAFFTPQPPPGNKKMTRLAVKRTAQRIRAWAHDKTGSDQWGLAYRFSESVEERFGISGFTKMLPPKDRFWADPFPVKNKDRFFIFMEEFPYSSNKGHISVIEMDVSGRWREPVKIIERDYHLSYPCVFKWEETYYMIPESGSNRTVELYKCVGFPYDWVFDRVMIDEIQAADPTLALIDGTWWLFAGTRPYNVPADDNYMELSLFSADSPFGPWKPHKANPVKSDTRSSRPAGNLFYWKGSLYRPAQDCSRDYGYAVSINRVTESTHEQYSEEEVSKILPEWIPGSKLIHTLNSCEGLTVIDTMNRTLKV